ncbi:Olfactory receptor 8G5 [Cricetulus griseus]|uniref:Olfactory receptor 8G5 n=1 Tax=Cricetulus griseus TaxID=10029 RepID=G3IC88_CRIGR|nr:Olfactory receptor 8G5 [Cricetulus griseus]
MAERNDSAVTEFILSWLTDQPELHLPLFLLFLRIYLLTVLGNLGMIILILLSSHLHTPMYLFLSSLSFIDLCYSTVITPKMLVNFVKEKNVISYQECMTQLYFFLVFVISECHMLAAMAYDCYVAICNPLLCNVTMSYQVCSLDGLRAFNILVSTLTILGSYIFIIASILHIKSTEGIFKAFSTCGSHFSAVAVFFGSLAFVYLQPSSVRSKDKGKVSSVFYTTIVPMLNPMIYSLRNRDVKTCSE